MIVRVLRLRLGEGIARKVILGIDGVLGGAFVPLRRSPGRGDPGRGGGLADVRQDGPDLDSGWLSCPPSPYLASPFPKPDKASSTSSSQWRTGMEEPASRWNLATDVGGGDAGGAAGAEAGQFIVAQAAGEFRLQQGITARRTAA